MGKQIKFQLAAYLLYERNTFDYIPTMIGDTLLIILINYDFKKKKNILIMIET